MIRSRLWGLRRRRCFKELVSQFAFSNWEERHIFRRFSLFDFLVQSPLSASAQRRRISSFVPFVSFVSFVSFVFVSFFFVFVLLSKSHWVSGETAVSLGAAEAEVPSSSSSESFSGEGEILFPGTPPDADGARTPRSVRLMPDPWLEAPDGQRLWPSQRLPPFGVVEWGEEGEAPLTPNASITTNYPSSTVASLAPPSSSSSSSLSASSTSSSASSLRSAYSIFSPFDQKSVLQGVSLPRGVDRLREQLLLLQLQRQRDEEEEEEEDKNGQLSASPADGEEAAFLHRSNLKKQDSQPSPEEREAPSDVSPETKDPPSSSGEEEARGEGEQHSILSSGRIRQSGKTTERAQLPPKKRAKADDAAPPTGVSSGVRTAKEGDAVDGPDGGSNFSFSGSSSSTPRPPRPPPVFDITVAQRRCQMRLKDAMEAASRGALIPELRVYVENRAEPPPILPLFLGGPLPPIPMVLPKAASILPGDLLDGVLRMGQLRVGVLGTDFLPSEVRHFGPDEILTGVSASVLERAVAIVSHNYSEQLQRRPVLVQYLVYSSRAALYAALLREDIHLTDLATPYSAAVSVEDSVLPSAKLHAALAPLHKNKAQDSAFASFAIEGEGSLNRDSRSSAFVWGSSKFFSDVVAGDPWAAVQVLASGLRSEIAFGGFQGLAARAFNLCSQQGRSGELPLQVLIEAAVPELADLAVPSLPPCVDFALVRLSRVPPSEAGSLFEALEAKDEEDEKEEEGEAEVVYRGQAGRRQEEMAFSKHWTEDGEDTEARRGAGMSGVERFSSVESSDREAGSTGLLLPGGVPLFSLSQALSELRSRRALVLLHVTPLNEILEGRSVLTAAPWLLETDSDLVLPLAAFFKRPQGARCIPVDPQLEFENVAAVAKRAAAQAFARQMRQDEEL